MTEMNLTDKTEAEPRDRFLLNPYTDWTAAQGIPVYQGFGVDMLACETKPWGFTEASMLSIGIRLCPPASNLALSRLARSSTASLTVAGS